MREFARVCARARVCVEHARWCWYNDGRVVCTQWAATLVTRDASDCAVSTLRSEIEVVEAVLFTPLI